MPIPAARASRVERKWTSLPSMRISPASPAWTPAMIFISVLFPAPFSPATPWIEPGRSAKSTPRNAWTPPNALVTPLSSRRGGAICLPSGSDQELLLHPDHAVGVGLGDDGAVGDDVLRDAARAGLLAVHDRVDARDDRAAMDAAGGVAHRRVHRAVLHRLDRRRHRVDAADLDLGAPLGLHDLGSGERHIVVMEERGVDLGVFRQQRFPDARHLGDIPVAGL